MNSGIIMSSTIDKSEWCHDTTAQAARNGDLIRLKYLHENGCEWNYWACTLAARHGHLYCLKYLHKNGVICVISACYEAADNGHLDCLKYLHEHGCEWNGGAVMRAASSGHLDCLKYLYENGCECSFIDHVISRTSEHSECLKYLCEKQGDIWKAYENGILEEDFTVIAYCPSCQTSLSHSEVNQGYEEVKDPSLYYKVKLVDEDAFLIVWTTMPGAVCSSSQ